MKKNILLLVFMLMFISRAQVCTGDTLPISVLNDEINKAIVKFSGSGLPIPTKTERNTILFEHNSLNFAPGGVNSLVNGNTLTTTASPTCGGVLPVLSWQQAIDCLGLATGTAADSVNTLNQIVTVNFQLNRPTSAISADIRHLQTMRKTYSTNTTVEKTNNRGGQSSADDHYQLSGDLGMFFSAGGSFGDVNTKPGYNGYNIYRRSANAGLDYRFSDMVSTGVLFNYLSSSATLASAGGNSNSDIFRFAPFISITPFENAFIDATVGYGYFQNDSSRNCGMLCGSLRGVYNTNEGFGSLNMGYVYYMGGGWTLTSYGQGSAIGMYNNGYNETGIGAFTNGIKVANNYALSVASTLGTELSFAWTTPYGVLVPRVFGEWLHEYKNDSRAISYQLQGAASFPPLGIQTASPIRNWANVGLGAQMTFQNSISAFVNYQSLVMTGATNHTIEGGVTIEF